MVAISPCLYAAFHVVSKARIFDGVPSGLLCATPELKPQTASPARTTNQILIFIGLRIFSRSIRLWQHRLSRESPNLEQGALEFSTLSGSAKPRLFLQTARN